MTTTATKVKPGKTYFNMTTDLEEHIKEENTVMFHHDEDNTDTIVEPENCAFLIEYLKKEKFKYYYTFDGNAVITINNNS